MANGFANLLAKQKEKANATQTQAGAIESTSEVRDVADDASATQKDAPTQSGVGQARPNPFARKSATPSATTEQSNEAKPKLAGFKMPANVAGKAAAATPAKVEVSTIDSFDDLANLDVSDLDEVRDTTTPPSGFADETPATAPIRELPEDLTQQQKNFVDMIDGVYEMIHDIDLMGNVIKAIMVEFKQNPEFESLIRDDDVRLWIRGMRNNMGLAKIRKQEAKSKRAGSGAKKGPKIDQDLLNDLNDLGINF